MEWIYLGLYLFWACVIFAIGYYFFYEENPDEVEFVLLVTLSFFYPMVLLFSPLVLISRLLIKLFKKLDNNN
jgi:RsiW-degrading membrane proteinase PrsW (M82 family)